MEIIKDVRLAVVVGASKALDYIESNPKVNPESVMRHIIERVNAKNKAKLASIAAANFVINYKLKNIRATKKEILKELTNSTEAIISAVDY